MRRRCAVAGLAAVFISPAVAQGVSPDWLPKKTVTILVGFAPGGTADTAARIIARSAPALQDLLGGRVASYYSTLSRAQPHIETGKLIPLAVTGSKRIPQLPQVPTIAESGFPGYLATHWYAFVAWVG